MNKLTYTVPGRLDERGQFRADPQNPTVVDVTLQFNGPGHYFLVARSYEGAPCTSWIDGTNPDIRYWHHLGYCESHRALHEAAAAVIADRHNTFAWYAGAYTTKNPVLEKMEQALHLQQGFSV